MRDQATKVAEEAAGSVDEQQLTDSSLLRGGSVLEYLSPDERLQYLFVSKNTGLKAAKLLHANVPRDFTSGGGTEKQPGRNYAAVMMITSHRVVYLVGGAKDDQRFSIDLDDVTASRREMNGNKPAIAVRNSTLKFLFTPDHPADIDTAVKYLSGKRDAEPNELESAEELSEATEESAVDQGSPKSQQSYKYSTGSATSTGNTQSGGKSAREVDGENEPQEVTAAAEQTDDSTPTTSGQQSKHAARSWDSASSSEGTDKGGVADKSTDYTANSSKSTVVTGSGDTESPRNEKSEIHGETEGKTRDDVDAEEPATETSSNSSTEAAVDTLPEAVTAHISLSQAAFEEFDSPFISPNEAYEAAITAYGELCRALEALPSDEYPDQREQIESRADDFEVLIELLEEYGPAITEAQALVERSNRDGYDSADQANRDSLGERLRELQSDAAELFVDTESIEKLCENLTSPNADSGDESSEPENDGDTTTGSNEREEGGSAGPTTAERWFEAATDETAAAFLADSSSYVCLQVTEDESPDSSVFKAVDPDGTLVWVNVTEEQEVVLEPGRYYRFRGVLVKEMEVSNSRSHRVIVTADAQIEELPTTKESGPSEDESSSGSSDGEATTTDEQTPTTYSRTERVAHHLFVADEAALDSETKDRVRELSDTLTGFDIRTAHLASASETINSLSDSLSELDETAPGLAGPYVTETRRRVEQQQRAIEEITATLVEARRKIKFADGDHTSLPQAELQALDERLSTAIALTDELGLDYERFVTLQSDLYRILDDSEAEEKPGDVGEPSSGELMETDSDIPANVLSEYYEVIRNLKDLTSAVREAVDDLDDPMQRWCDAVEAFYLGEMDGYPCYGELQGELNEFSMSEYREAHGDGDRVTQFSEIEVEPLSSTVKQLLEDVSAGQLEMELYLPVGPESGIRLPVLVETDAEVERAVDLLRELPKSFQETVREGETAGSTGSKGSTNGDGPPAGEDPTNGSSHSGGGGTGVAGEEPADDSQDDSEGADEDDPALTDIGGVTPAVAAALKSEGITTRAQLTAIGMDELAAIEGVGPAMAQRIKMQIG